MNSFYGWEKADIKEAHGWTPKDYYVMLSEIWCAETCAPRLRERWCSANKTLGQCSVTAFLMQDIFGGKVYGIRRTGGGVHCFNVVGDCVFDLTSEQFGDEVLDYSDCLVQDRAVHFANKEKWQRYLLLKKALEEAVGRYDKPQDK